MFSTIVVILAVWFFGSIPAALFVGRLLGKHSNTPAFEAASEPMAVLQAAS